MVSKQVLNKHILTDFRLVNNILLFLLSLYSLWLLSIDISNGDREWILDNNKNLGYVDVTKLSGENLQKYENKLKFHILPGSVLMLLKFISGVILLIGSFVRFDVRFTIFAFAITSYDLVLKIAHYILSIYHLHNELQIDDFGRFLMDTTAWLLFQIAFVLFIHEHVEYLSAQEVANRFISHFPNIIDVDVVRELQSRNKDTRIACIANRFSSFFGGISGSVRNKSKIPVKRRTLIQKWMQIWRGDTLREHPSQLSVMEVTSSIFKNINGQSHIPVHKRHSRQTSSVSQATVCSALQQDSELLSRMCFEAPQCCCTPLLEMDAVVQNWDG